jgi:hypothetical protein
MLTDVPRAATRLGGVLFSADVRSLALLRVALAVVVAGDLVSRSTDLTAFYSDDGVLPRSVQIEHHTCWVGELSLYCPAPPGRGGR